MNNGSTATITRPTLECRNPSCFEWAQPATAENGICDACHWQLATVTDNDVALRMPNGEYALVDRAECLAVGSELKMKAWAIRLRVQSIGHGLDHYKLPCVCWHGKPTAAHTENDLTTNGDCRYCDGNGEITLQAARVWAINNRSA